MTDSDASARKTATVAQLTQRVEELEREVAESRHGESLQRALYEIASLSTTDSPEHEHFAQLHEIVSRLMHAKNFIIATYDAEEGMIHQEYMVDEDTSQPKESFPYGEGMSSLVLRTRIPWLMDNNLFQSLVAQGEIRAVHGLDSFNSWMGVPLLVQDQIYGLIIVQSYSAEINYTQADLDLLTFVASHVAVTAARWKANAALKRAMDDLAASAETLRLVGNIGKDLTKELNTEAICRTLEKRFSALLQVDVFCVALLSPEGNALDLVFYIEDGVIDEPISLPLDHPTSLLALTFREDRELILFDDPLMAEAPGASSFIENAPISSAVLRPLIANGRRIGVVTVQSHQANAYSERDLEVFRSAASFAAIALANADAFTVAEKARRQAARALEDQQQAEAQLVHSEKMAALGQLIAGVAHEINTPIGAIKSSGNNISDALDSALIGLPALIDELDATYREHFSALIARANKPKPLLSTREERAIVRDVTAALEALDVNQARHRAGLLVQMQSHTDLDLVLPLLRHPAADRILDIASGISTISTNTGNINTAVDRVAKIIFALKSFSRFGGEHVWTESDLAEGLETVLTIYQNQIKHGTDLVRQFQEIPHVRCLPDEINQVWTNLIHNALQAMDHKGTLTISISRDGEDALVSISDTGCGMPPEIQKRIFEPFFTTKPTGEGTGLGLDIVRKIVEKHMGRITVESMAGQGTTFTVRLPIAGAG